MRKLRNLSGQSGKASLNIWQAMTEEKQLDQQAIPQTHI